MDFTTKLSESGLTLQDAEELGIVFVKSAATLHPSFANVPSIKLNYYCWEGQPLSDLPEHVPYYRLRYLQKIPSPPQTVGKKQPKYMQLKNTLPVAYYPKNQNWLPIVNDVAQPIIFTEGEFKAAKACKEGFPTIALGGVNSWQALKKGVYFLKSLEVLNLVGRCVYICFDSDFKTNVSVCKALCKFSEALQDRGADVRLVVLPQLSMEGKTGLDDFFVQSGESAPLLFNRLLKDAEPLGLYKVLFEFNKRYICVYHPICVYDTHTHKEIPPDKFKTFTEASEKFAERVLLANGGIRYEIVSAAKVWIAWRLRNAVDELTYQPGQPKRVVYAHLGHTITGYNMWRGWAVKPKEGDVSLFLTLIDFLFSESTQSAKSWFLDWLAYPLQFPGTKLYTAAVLHSIQQGVGKSLVGYTMARIYGENFREFKQRDLKSNFTSWAVNKQFLMGDDITGDHKSRAYADMLKALITQKTMTIDKKFIPTYDVPDCINYLFTTNQPDAFFLEDTDRRFFVHECPQRLLDITFYTQDYDRWLHSKSCGEAVFYYLLQRDLRGFNPRIAAPMTAAKEQMIDIGRSDLASWVRSVLREPEKMLAIGDQSYSLDLISVQELLTFYDPTHTKRTTAGGIGRELSRAGAVMVAQGVRLLTTQGQRKLYILRDTQRWLSASREEILAHYNSMGVLEKSKF